jgi:hypothetical protein
VGYGYFVYPTNKHYLSGFDYSPQTNHNGLILQATQAKPSMPRMQA